VKRKKEAREPGDIRWREIEEKEEEEEETDRQI